MTTKQLQCQKKFTLRELLHIFSLSRTNKQLCHLLLTSLKDANRTALSMREFLRSLSAWRCRPDVTPLPRFCTLCNLTRMAARCSCDERNLFFLGSSDADVDSRDLTDCREKPKKSSAHLCLVIAPTLSRICGTTVRQDNEVTLVFEPCNSAAHS